MIRSRSFEQYLLLILILIFFFWMSLGILKPIVLGLFMALVLDPVRLWAQGNLPKVIKSGPLKFRGENNLLSATLTLLFIGLVLFPLIYIGTVVVRDGQMLLGGLAKLAQSPDTDAANPSQIQILIDSFYEKIHNFLPITREDYVETLRKIATAIVDFCGTWIASIARSIPALLMELVLFILALYFGLADGRKLDGLFKTVLPFDKKDVAIFAKTTESICRGVVVGSLISGLIQGSLIGFAYWIFDVPRPVFFGVMTAVFSFIPFLGALPAGLGATIYLYSGNQTGYAISMLIAWGIASLADNIVKPLALKGQVSLHPLLAFVSVIGGLSLFGFAGLFLGPVVAAFAVVVVDMLGTRSFAEHHS
jgi:predicted PurR-regulated permease PerM